jgi:hypothetical protein
MNKVSTGSNDRDRGAAVAGENHERRQAAERRQHVLRALLQGSLRPRRHGPRRSGDRPLCAVDWHHPQWLAIGLLIVLFSGSDALLTLMLVEHGAYEANPLMAPLVGGSGLSFVLVKIGLTATGVVLLTQLARVRAFGRIPVGVLLYTMLLVYSVLIVYECGLLQSL